MRFHHIIASILLIAPIQALAQAPSLNDGYTREEFVSENNCKIPYRQLSPEKINAGEKYPLIVFLHGSGERGTDNEKQLLHGGAMFSNPATVDKYPAYVLFPQCKEKAWTGNVNPRDFMSGANTPNESPTEIAVIDLIKDFVSNHPVDTNRIYLIGISMGGIATYDLACRYPDMFAAAVPICGAVNPERLSNAKDVHFLIFHGEEDDEVPSLCSREAYKALSGAGATVDYVEFAGMGHECWNAAFNYPSLLPWLFSQEKTNDLKGIENALTYNEE